MSVAFRRDSDEEHLEPKFELPIPAGPNLVTQRGLELIDARVAELQGELQQGEDEAVTEPIRRQLRYWEQRQISAELAPHPEGDKVALGTTITLSLNGATRTFEIVGHDEAEPSAGLIAFGAPLSRAMLGAEVGDVLPFAGAADAIEILAIAVSAGRR
jgi:transcription elongation GreA/GreB family factor